MLKIKVPFEYPTIEAALEAIPSGGEAEIELAPGIYHGNWTVTKGQEISVRGSGKDLTFLDGRGNGSVFEVKNGNLNLSRLTIQNGFAKRGGGLHFVKASGTLENVTFTGNEASFDGGGMYLESSSPTLSNVTFTGNTATYDGGGMYLYASSPTLTHVTFTGNRADGKYEGFGGGMYLNSSSPTLKNCILAYNQASSSGGNLYRDTDESTPSTLKTQNSLIYNPSGWAVDNITPSGSYLTVEPKFLAYTDSKTGASC